MTKLLLILALLLSSPTYAQVGKDKYYHASLSALGATSCIVIFKRKVECALAMLAIGVAKELSDPVFSKEDLIADGIGISFVFIIGE